MGGSWLAGALRSQHAERSRPINVLAADVDAPATSVVDASPSMDTDAVCHSASRTRSGHGGAERRRGPTVCTMMRSFWTLMLGILAALLAVSCGLSVSEDGIRGDDVFLGANFFS